MVGVIAFHTYTMYPFFYILTGAGLSRIDAALAEAGKSIAPARPHKSPDENNPAPTDPFIDRGGVAHFHDLDGFFQRTTSVWRRCCAYLRSRSTPRGNAAIQLWAFTETVILAVISLSALVFFQRYQGARKFAAAALKGSTKKRMAIRNGSPPNRDRLRSYFLPATRHAGRHA